MIVEIRALRPDDDRASFQSGDAALDLFFHRYAGQSQFRHHVGVTYVAIADGVIVGFLTVSPATIDGSGVPKAPRVPYPVPVLRVARLAVREGARRAGIGRRLLRFSIELAERMQDEFGCVGLVVDSKAQAVDFYGRFGFVHIGVMEGGPPQVPSPMTLFLPLGGVPRRPGGVE